MIQFLLLISFIIHIILIYLVITLYREVKRHEQADIKQSLQQFMEELREENQIIETKLSRLTMEKQSNNHQKTPPINSTESTKPFSDLIQQASIRINESQMEENRTTEHKYHIEDIQRLDEVETSLESKIFKLDSEGLTIEQIAKKLNRGKTEVELILKLQKK